MMLLPSPVLPHVVPDVVRHLAGAVDLPQEGEEGGDVHLGAEAGQGRLAPGVEGVALGETKVGCEQWFSAEISLAIITWEFALFPPPPPLPPPLNIWATRSSSRWALLRFLLRLLLPCCWPGILIGKKKKVTSSIFQRDTISFTC